MKVSRSKTEYMCVNEREGSGTVRLQGEEVKKVQEFKYLGSTVQSNGECGKEVKKRVQAGSENRYSVLLETRFYRSNCNLHLEATTCLHVFNRYVNATLKEKAIRVTQHCPLFLS
ncbi:hypothetical protein QTP86_007280 [Hemibagrus guttatus]|nr:hypothetical protein QTP86_007280 [Hemibagrus guttatus]